MVSYHHQEEMWSLRFADGAEKKVDLDDLKKVTKLCVVLWLGVVVGACLMLCCGLR